MIFDKCLITWGPATKWTSHRNFISRNLFLLQTSILYSVCHPFASRKQKKSRLSPIFPPPTRCIVFLLFINVALNQVNIISCVRRESATRKTAICWECYTTSNNEMQFLKSMFVYPRFLLLLSSFMFPSNFSFHLLAMCYSCTTKDEWIIEIYKHRGSVVERENDTPPNNSNDVVDARKAGNYS